MSAVATAQGTVGLEDCAGQLFGLSLVASVTNPTGLDLIQIVGQGENVLVNVDKNGTVHFPSLNPSSTGLFGEYQSRLTSSATLAQIFADAFSNPSLLDILQVINVGGKISYWLDAVGVAHGS